MTEIVETDPKEFAKYVKEMTAKHNGPPRYKLTEKCYLNDRLYEPPSIEEEDNADNRERIANPFDNDTNPLPAGTRAATNASQLRPPIVISWIGEPAYYMQPMNETAKAICARYPAREFNDPIRSLQIIGAVSNDPVDRMQVMVEKLVGALVGKKVAA